MRAINVILASAAVAAVLGLAGAASAATVSVAGTAGPWDPTNPSNPTYGVGDQSAPTSVGVTPGEALLITYQSGLTSAFGGAPPSVDALGYTGLSFGSGVGFSGIGSSGQPFPSFTIDPTNSGSPVYLNALIGDFVDASGVVIGSPFAPGDGPFNITAPVGAVALQLGVNDDIFSDNSGSLNIGVSGVPEPATWAMMLLGIGLVGAGLRVRRLRNVAVADAA